MLDKILEIILKKEIIGPIIVILVSWILYKIVKNNGLIVSEYPLGTEPNKNNFPKRNRIISGICNGVLVIEAREKSGALITVNYALDQGKEIYVVPRKPYK